MDMSRSMMASADSSLNFWGEALSTSTYILNRITTTKKQKIDKFIEYSQNGSGYRFYHKDKGLIESKDAIFIEDVKQTTPLEELKLLEEQETL